MERSIRKKVLVALASIVVFCTVYALILPAITMENETYCGYEEHEHDSATCFEQSLICTEESETHVHEDACYESNLICTLEEHVHVDACFVDPNAEEEVTDEDTSEVSEADTTKEATVEEPTADAQEEELPELTTREQEEVDAVIALIAELPDVDTVEKTLSDYEDEEDWESYEAYYTKVGQNGRAAYEAYEDLDEDQQEAVTNSDRLFDLEWLWSAVTLTTLIPSEAADDIVMGETITKNGEEYLLTSTSEFIELNLYDYGSNINDLYNNNKNQSYTDGNGNTKYTSKYPGFQWNGGAYTKSYYDRHEVDFIDFGNSMITDMDYEGSGNGKSTTAANITVNTDYFKNINSMDVTSYGVTNRPIGMSLNSSITSTTFDVLQRTLGDDGYPALADGTSLSYLFSDGTYADKKNTQSIDGLFLQNQTTGQYEYNSRENHAQYSNNKFTLYKDIITPNFIVYPFGNFLPFNDITNENTSTQVSQINRVVSGSDGYSGYIQTIINRLLEDSEDATENQLITMLAKYRDNLGALNDTDSKRYTWNAADAINDYFTGNDSSDDKPSSKVTFEQDSDLLKNMYNIDYDVDTNFFFGMDMSMSFMQPKNGMTGKDNDNDGINDYPMEFYFTGDDDVWVYVDDVLFLDLSGIHRHVGGQIDYVNGLVHYYYLDTANTGDVSSTPYKTYTFEQILKAAGWSDEQINSSLQNVKQAGPGGGDKVIELNGENVQLKTFKDYSTHEFKFYYMERGSGSSVCRMNFNFPLLKKNTISVGKEVTGDEETLGDVEYKFQVLKANADGTKTDELFIPAGTSYTITNADGSQDMGLYYTDENGIFTLKKGQIAEFTNISENAGKYYVREVLTEAEHEQYGTITVLGGTSEITIGDIVVGGQSFVGADSDVRDASHGSTRFVFNNQVDINETGKLKIEKVLDAKYSGSNKNFTFNVLISGKRLPKGTEYEVTDAEDNITTKTVETDGQIVIKGGETALIENLLVGAAFNVSETETSAKGYVVTYEGATSEDAVTSNGTGAEGYIHTNGTAVTVKITNAENGAAIDIPLEKTLANPYEGTYSYDYTFKLKRIGTDEEYTKTITLSNETSTVTVDKAFTLTYLASDSEIEAIEKGKSKEFHYQLTELDNAVAEGQIDHTASNTTVYDVYVTVSKDENGLISATKVIKKNDVAVDTPTFTNTLIGDLMISKVMEGVKAAEDGFNFDVTLTKADGTALSGKFGEYTFDEDGKAVINLKPEGDEVATALISGLPVGTKWTVTEQENDDFVAFIEVTGDDDANIDGNTVSGEISVSGTQIKAAYTNKSAYTLPLTGGEGTTRYMMSGMLLMAAALVLYTIYRKRRVEE